MEIVDANRLIITTMFPQAIIISFANYLGQIVKVEGVSTLMTNVNKWFQYINYWMRKNKLKIAETPEDLLVEERTFIYVRTEGNRDNRN